MGMLTFPKISLITIWMVQCVTTGYAYNHENIPDIKYLIQHDRYQEFEGLDYLESGIKPGKVRYIQAQEPYLEQRIIPREKIRARMREHKKCWAFCHYYKPRKNVVDYVNYGNTCQSSNSSVDEIQKLKKNTNFDLIDHVFNKGEYSDKLFSEESDRFWNSLMVAKDLPKHASDDTAITMLKSLVDENEKTYHRMFIFGGGMFDKERFIIAAFISTGTAFGESNQKYRVGANNNLSGVQAILLAVRAAQRTLQRKTLSGLYVFEVHFYVMNHKTKNMQEVTDIMEYRKNRLIAGYIEVSEVGFKTSKQPGWQLRVTQRPEGTKFASSAMKLLNCQTTVDAKPKQGTSDSAVDFAEKYNFPALKLESVPDHTANTNQGKLSDDTPANLNKEAINNAAIALYSLIMGSRGEPAY